MNDAMMLRAAYDPLDISGQYKKSKEEKAAADAKIAEDAANFEAQQKGLQEQKNVSMLKSQGANFKKGGVVSASRRADGIAQRGKTRGKMC
jgi:hypothetical protein